MTSGELQWKLVRAMLNEGIDVTYSISKMIEEFFEEELEEYLIIKQ